MNNADLTQAKRNLQAQHQELHGSRNTSDVLAQVQATEIATFTTRVASMKGEVFTVVSQLNKEVDPALRNMRETSTTWSR